MAMAIRSKDMKLMMATERTIATLIEINDLLQP
jgi:hypothetical protein